MYRMQTRLLENYLVYFCISTDMKKQFELNLMISFVWNKDFEVNIDLHFNIQDYK